MDKVSVIVPVYNIEQYIARCLESLINQTYSEIEIIVVNDGSTDSSTRIVNVFEKRDPRIIHVYQNNSGLSSARNNGLSVASGIYVLFVDGDDYISANCIEALLNEMQKDDEVDVVCFPYIKLFKTKQELAKLFHGNRTRFSPSATPPIFFIIHAFPPPGKKKPQISYNLYQSNSFWHNEFDIVSAS